MSEPGRYVFLSHPFGPDTPTWLDNPPVKLRGYSAIADGDVCNQTVIETLNHNGTHFDAPLHFAAHGRSVTDYAAEEFVFRRPLILDIAKADDELVTVADLEPHAAALNAVDLLLLRTGFERYRGDAARYGRKSPGLAAEAGPYLLQFEALRALGVDIPSVTAPAHLDEGIAFHQAVLGAHARDSKTLLLIEDMHLPLDLSGSDIDQVVMAPLRLEDRDGAPVTVIARTG